jgi:hypothetical protein
MEFWFLFPTGVLIATLAMSSGIAGSNFWALVYLLGLALEPRVAFWMSLLTMLFGFGSGVVGHWRAGTLDRQWVARYAPWVVPAAAVGAWLSTRLPVQSLLLAFAAFVVSYGLFLLREFLIGRAERPPRDGIAWPGGLLAGFLQGLIATGSGITLLPLLLRQRGIANHRTAVGTTVALVFLASLTSALARLDAALWNALVASQTQVFAMISFAAPGVVIGGQLGPRLSHHISRRHLRLYLGLLLLLVGGLLTLRALGG